MWHHRILSCLLVSVFLASLLPAGLAEKTTYKVARVIDGDTIELENGERVRYIGIDTPETKHLSKPVEYYGREADSAKRPVGVRIVRALFGIGEQMRASMVMLATISFFTRAAHEFQKTLKHRLSLKDYNDLVAWLERYGLRG